MISPKLIRITTVPFSINTLLSGQIRYMAEKGMDVKMLCSYDDSIKIAIEREGVPYIRLDMSRNFNVLKDLQSLLKMIQIFRKEQPDIIHTNTVKAGLISMIAGWWVGVKIRVYTVGGFKFHSSTYSPMKRRFIRFIEQSVYFFATDVWPNNPRLVSEIRRLKMAPDHKVFMIGNGSTNGVDLQKFNPDGIEALKINDIKEQINYDPSCRYLLFVGRICGDKGIAELLWAYEEVCQTIDNIKLILVGPIEQFDDPLPDQVLNKIQSDLSIIHINWSDEVEVYMKIADYFVFPSHREGLPNVVMQAGAMKLPVLCSDILGNIDIVTDHHTGILFEQKNKLDLKNKLLQMLAGKYELHAYAENLYQKILDRYDRRVVQQAIYEEYQQLLTKN